MAVYRGVPWRFVFTDLATATTTWAEGITTNRSINLTLDAASTFTCNVFSDDKRVNLLYSDGYPLIAQSNRLVYGFRREGVTEGLPWVPRYAGIVMSPEDVGADAGPSSSIAAYDPWKYLEARPCVDLSGNLPGPEGFFKIPITGEKYALSLLLWSILSTDIGFGFAIGPLGVGNGTFIDAGDGSRIGEGDQYADWGGTSFYAGTIEVTNTIEFNVQQGMSIAEAWSSLCDAGNMDIVLTPIYDPDNRPGYTHELNIYRLAGVERPDAIFGWDRVRRNLRNIDRAHDGTPGSYFNRATFFTSNDGIPVPLGPPPYYEPYPASTAVYNAYWQTLSFPSLTGTYQPANQILALMDGSLELAKQGKRTITADVLPERAPVPLLDYDLGDRVLVYASKALRVISEGLQRVEAIPIAISDDGIETVSSLLLSPDYRTDSLPPAP